MCNLTTKLTEKENRNDPESIKVFKNTVYLLE